MTKKAHLLTRDGHAGAGKCANSKYCANIAHVRQYAGKISGAWPSPVLIIASTSEMNDTGGLYSVKSRMSKIKNYVVTELP